TLLRRGPLLLDHASGAEDRLERDNDSHHVRHPHGPHAGDFVRHHPDAVALQRDRIPQPPRAEEILWRRPAVLNIWLDYRERCARPLWLWGFGGAALYRRGWLARDGHLRLNAPAHAASPAREGYRRGDGAAGAQDVQRYELPDPGRLCP